MIMIMIMIMHDYAKKYLRYNFQLTYFYDARETLVERCIADYPPTLKVAFQFGYILLSLLFTNLNSRLMNYIYYLHLAMWIPRGRNKKVTFCCCSVWHHVEYALHGVLLHEVILYLFWILNSLIKCWFLICIYCTSLWGNN